MILLPVTKKTAPVDSAIPKNYIDIESSLYGEWHPKFCFVFFVVMSYIRADDYSCSLQITWLLKQPDKSINLILFVKTSRTS